MRTGLVAHASRATARARAILAALAILVAASVFSSAMASETIKYTYDAMGRLVKVDHGSTGPNANVTTNYTYDNADNRCGVSVSTNGSAAAACAAPSGGGSLTLSPTALPGGSVGITYPSTTITASGGSGTYSYQVSSGTLPAGLTLSSGGLLSGIPTTATTFNFTITATDGDGRTGSQVYSVTIAQPTITLSPASLPGAVVGSSYSKTITASGGSGGYSYQKTAGNLPTGLTLSSGGLLSGSPTVAGTFSFTITATDNSGSSGSRAYSVAISIANVVLSPTTLPLGVVGTAYSATITANGGSGGYSFAKTAGTLAPGLTLYSGGLLSGTPSMAADYNFTITATDDSGHSGSRAYAVTINAATVTILPMSLPGGTVGTAYYQTISASGGSGGYTFSVSAGSLPTGLTLNSSTGKLSGTPTTAGSYSFTILVKDNTGHGAFRSYGISINAAGNQPPVANPDAATTTVCQTIFINVIANDTDPDGDLPLTLVSVSGIGYSVFSSTTVQFDAPNSPASRSGTYVVQDSRGAQSTGNVNVGVNPGTCSIGGGGGTSSPPSSTTDTGTDVSSDPALSDPSATDPSQATGTSDPTQTPPADPTTPQAPPSGGE